MSIPAPSSPPQNFTAAALSPNSITLTWSPPPLHSQNGNIREYRINMTELETGMESTFSTADTSLNIPLLHPYYTYECIVTAFTVATGPHAEVSVTTPENSEFIDCSLH